MGVKLAVFKHFDPLYAVNRIGQKYFIGTFYIGYG